MTKPPSTAADYFGGMVESYDSLIRRAVPRYDELTDRLIEYLPGSPARILELGCGTGNLTLRLAARFPASHITAVDASGEMTTITTVRASKLGVASRLTTLTARFEDLEFSAESFDLVASCMSLHHVRDKAPLYRGIGRWLARSGTLAIADQLLGATRHITSVHWDLWLKFCREPGHCSEAEIESLEAHAAAHDHYTPLSEHFAMLADAGFSDMDCLWRNGMYSVIMASR